MPDKKSPYVSPAREQPVTIIDKNKPAATVAEAVANAKKQAAAASKQ